MSYSSSETDEVTDNSSYTVITSEDDSDTKTCVDCKRWLYDFSDGAPKCILCQNNGDTRYLCDECVLVCSGCGNDEPWCDDCTQYKEFHGCAKEYEFCVSCDQPFCSSLPFVFDNDSETCAHNPSIYNRTTMTCTMCVPLSSTAYIRHDDAIDESPDSD